MLSTRQQDCLRGIGVRIWRERADADRPATEAALPGAESTAANTPPMEKESVHLERAGNPPSGMVVEDTGGSPLPRTVPVSDYAGWDGLTAAIHACNACALAQNCTQKVPGVGDRNADLMIIGEGPGHDEDIRGEPFVGRSGQLLDRMLAAIGINRDQVYITNIVKCRPPNNRDPKHAEATQCRAYLEAQIERIGPKVILSVGRVSAHNLLGSSQPVGKLIRQMHRLPGTEVPVKVTYHPAYLLRNPAAKAIAWQDLKLLHQMLQ